MYRKKVLYLFVSLLVCGATGFAESGEAQQQLAAKFYVSQDLAVNDFLAAMRQFGEMSAIDTSTNFLNQAITTAGRNVSRNIDTSRDMITQVQQGLEAFDNLVRTEVEMSERLRSSLDAVIKSFERRIRAVEDAKGIKRGIFS